MFKVRVKRLKADYIKATKKGAETLVLALVKQGKANSIRLVAKDTGRLAGSIDTEAKRYKGSWFTILAYALAQEYGLPGTKYRFRPYMRPGARALKSVMSKLAKKWMRKAYKNMRVQRDNG